MWISWIFRSSHQLKKCRLVSSGPLSHRIASGIPRLAITSSGDRVTRRLDKLGGQHTSSGQAGSVPYNAFDAFAMGRSVRKSDFKIAACQNRMTPLISTKRGEAAPPATNAPRILVGGATSAMILPKFGLEMSASGWSKLG
jgi:hypothetical protein